MNLLPTADQAEITAVIREFLANEVPARRYQEQSNREQAYSAELWQQFVDIGWFGVAADTAHGGSGLGIAEEILLAREAGRQLVSPTVLATAFTARLSADLNQETLCKAFICGEQRAAFALAYDDGYQLLMDSDAADFLLTISNNSLSLHSSVAPDAVQDLKGTDESVRLARAPLSEGLAIHRAESQDRLRLALLLCAALTGVAERACHDAVQYAGEREQFGQPIGAFQAINHLCADMAVRNDACWSQTVFAALALSHNNTDAARQTAAAAELTTTAAIDNARANVQIHGGVGFTIEFDAHLLVKRTHLLSQLLKPLLARRKLLLAQ